jgi:hypothetical protein
MIREDAADDQAHADLTAAMPLRAFDLAERARGRIMKLD